MTRRIFWLGIIIFFSMNLYSQNISKDLEKIRKEVVDINQQTLNKSTFLLCKQEIENISIVDYEKVSESVTYVYADTNSVVRKSIHMNNYPEYSGFTVHYYNSLGNVIYTIIKESSALNPAVIGIRAIANNKPLYTDIQFNDDNNHLIKEKEFWFGKDLDTENITFNIKSTEDLNKYLTQTYNFNSLESEEKMKVRFIHPTKGERTIINARKVNIREKPSFNSKIINQGGLGSDNFIVEVLKQVESQGEIWYLINIGSISGYIYGRLIEPIE
ncbi:SH3 domain-containing protein [Dysgonomonas sp. Marseille-P4361]|uniref:SH3 domain-containing protein n=1 Tax=Dysgonomonas sp. Marseille-P4361 TaxID=2161820 RepID=UPI00135955C1|nr:SH3 domain-containing protein [Dysgonomonas sp. Marseille-P4361]